MRAVIIPEPGGPEVLTISDVPAPDPGPGDVIIDVAAAGENRVDILQRTGNYQPTPGATDWPRQVCARTISAVGANVQNRQDVQRAMALLSGGGYAEKVAVPDGQVMPVPEYLTLNQA